MGHQWSLFEGCCSGDIWISIWQLLQICLCQKIIYPIMYIRLKIWRNASIILLLCEIIFQFHMKDFSVSMCFCVFDTNLAAVEIRRLLYLNLNLFWQPTSELWQRFNSNYKSGRFATILISYKTITLTPKHDWIDWTDGSMVMMMRNLHIYGYSERLSVKCSIKSLHAVVSITTWVIINIPQST